MSFCARQSCALFQLLKNDSHKKDCQPTRCLTDLLFGSCPFPGQCRAQGRHPTFAVRGCIRGDLLRHADHVQLHKLPVEHPGRGWNVGDHHVHEVGRLFVVAVREMELDGRSAFRDDFC